MAEWKDHIDEKSRAAVLKCTVCESLARDKEVTQYVESICRHLHCVQKRVEHRQSSQPEESGVEVIETASKYLQKGDVFNDGNWEGWRVSWIQTETFYDGRLPTSHNGELIRIMTIERPDFPPLLRKQGELQIWYRFDDVVQVTRKTTESEGDHG